jgi:hypothetical protein
MLSPLPTNGTLIQLLTSSSAPDLVGSLKIEKLRTMGPAKAIDSFVGASPDFTPSPTWVGPHEDKLVKQIKEVPTK